MRLMVIPRLGPRSKWIGLINQFVNVEISSS